MIVNVVKTKQSFLPDEGLIPDWRDKGCLQIDYCCDDAFHAMHIGVLHIQTDGRSVGISFADGCDTLAIKFCPFCGREHTITGLPN